MWFTFLIWCKYLYPVSSSFSRLQWKFQYHELGQKTTFLDGEAGHKLFHISNISFIRAHIHTSQIWAFLFSGSTTLRCLYLGERQKRASTLRESVVWFLWNLTPHSERTFWTETMKLRQKITLKEHNVKWRKFLILYFSHLQRTSTFF